MPETFFIRYKSVKLALGPDGAAEEISDTNPLPVNIISGGAGGSSGGLTNTELRASPVPISGTVTANVGTVPVTGAFYPATQPISGSVSVSGSVAVTGAFFQATQPVSIAATVAVSGPVTDAQLRATALPISGNVGITGSVAVTGAFYPVTQPVSGTVSVSGSVAVTGAFFQVTQPVSIAATVAVSGPVTDAQLRASAVPVSLASLPALAAGTNLIGRTQAQYAARVARNFILDAFTAAPVSEALQSIVQWYNNAAVNATTQPAVVPTGKILRLTSWGIETKSLATVGSAVVRVRANTGGVAVLASPLAGSFSAGSIAGATTTAMTGAFCGMTGDFGEGGLEFAAGTGIGFSMAGYGPTGTLTLEGVTRFWVYGYEYTA